MVKPLVSSSMLAHLPFLHQKEPEWVLKSPALVFYLKIGVICVPTLTLRPSALPRKHHVTADKNNTFGRITFQGVSLCVPVMSQMSH